MPVAMMTMPTKATTIPTPMSTLATTWQVSTPHLWITPSTLQDTPLEGF